MRRIIIEQVFTTLVLSALILPDLTPVACMWTACEPCRTIEECDANPKDYCPWGEARDSCNRRICAKGPGERCGGRLDVLGTCGEGLMCYDDERCHGCSLITLDCFNKE